MKYLRTFPLESPKENPPDGYEGYQVDYHDGRLTCAALYKDTIFIALNNPLSKLTICLTPEATIALHHILSNMLDENHEYFSLHLPYLKLEDDQHDS